MVMENPIAKYGRMEVWRCKKRNPANAGLSF